MIMDYIMVFAIGIITGFIVSMIRNKFETIAGVITIDSSDVKDTYRLEVDNLDSLHTKKRVIFKISQN